jgi:hypothetical protein
MTEAWRPRQLVPQQRVSKGWDPSHQLSSTYSRIHLEDANQGDLFIDFGHIEKKDAKTKVRQKVLAWHVRFTLSAGSALTASWDSLGKQWGGWRFNKDKSCIILDIPFAGPTRLMPEFFDIFTRRDVFVLRGTGSQLQPGQSGPATYILRPAKDALADPISWEALDPAGDPNAQLWDIVKRRGGLP